MYLTLQLSENGVVSGSGRIRQRPTEVITKEILARLAVESKVFTPEDRYSAGYANKADPAVIFARNIALRSAESILSLTCKDME